MEDYRLIPLHGKYGEGKFAKVDAGDYPWLIRYSWNMNSGGQIYARIGNKIQLMSRYILDAPRELEVDHENHDQLDNRRSKLRLCTRLQNTKNVRAHKDGSSRYKGVCWNKAKQKWEARINAQGKATHLGYFELELDAARAYNEAALRLHGEFARLNELEDE